jgi:FHIPEP family
LLDNRSPLSRGSCRESTAFNPGGRSSGRYGRISWAGERFPFSSWGLGTIAWRFRQKAATADKKATGSRAGKIGLPTHEPAFGVSAVWISPDGRHARELCSRQEAKNVLDRVNEDNSKVIEDLVPKVLSLAVVQKVLQNPLRERVSIRDAVSIVEALGEAAPIAECVRPAIRRQVVRPLLEPSRDLNEVPPGIGSSRWLKSRAL